MKKFISVIGVCIAMVTAQQSSATENAEAALEMINPEGLFDPAPYGFSHASVQQQVGRVAFIAGQGGENKSGLLSDDFAVQVRQAYQNLSTIIASIGAKPQDVMKLTTYVVDHNQSKLEVLTRELKAVFGGHLPAQTLIPVPRLALDGMLFEVDAVAVIRDEGTLD